jgi:hypothetical protein
MVFLRCRFKTPFQPGIEKLIRVFLLYNSHASDDNTKLNSPARSLLLREGKLDDLCNNGDANMSRFFNAVPYVLAIGTIVLGFLQLVKEWGEYKDKRWLRIAVLVVLMVVSGLTLVGLRLDDQSRQAEKLKSEGDIRDLKGEVEAASKSQKDNTASFLDSVGKMSKEVADLKNGIKTEALRKQLASVQADLKQTLTHPKAELNFTFLPFKNPRAGSGVQPELVTGTTLPLNVDGSVHIEFVIVNNTQTEAANIDVNIILCAGCRYAKEPQGTTTDPAQPETTRLLNIPRIEAMQISRTIVLDVTPPVGVSSFEVGFGYRCSTCLLQQDMQGSGGTVHIQGR